VKQNILIVEDENDILHALMFAFRKEGFICTSAQTGPDALVAVSQAVPDLVVLDLNIPGLDGMEVCLRIKNDPPTAGVKIIMLTARAQREDKFLGHEVGADAYITKPFNLEQVIAKARELLK
jgi:two-component system, OmpR family, alkaline phosphatase synthesis response regulator PhoP